MLVTVENLEFPAHNKQQTTIFFDFDEMNLNLFPILAATNAIVIFFDAEGGELLK